MDQAEYSRVEKKVEALIGEPINRTAMYKIQYRPSEGGIPSMEVVGYNLVPMCSEDFPLQPVGISRVAE